MNIIPYLEIEATEACNLSCNNCLHFSNYNLKNIFTNKERMTWIHNFFKFLKVDMKKQFKVDTFRVVGGEPFLNKNIYKLVGLLVFYKKQNLIDNIIICTNGLVLNKKILQKLSEFKNDISIVISLHSDNTNYVSNIHNFLEALEEYKITYNIENYKPSSWRINFKTKQHKIYPANQNNPYLSWKDCPSKECKTLLEDKIYFCPPIAHLPKVLNKTKQLEDEEWQPYLNVGFFNYKNLSYDDFKTKILQNSYETFCNMCYINKYTNKNNYLRYKND